MWPFSSADPALATSKPQPQPQPQLQSGQVSETSACPVPHHLRSSYEHPFTDPKGIPGHPASTNQPPKDWRDSLSRERVVSSIPRSSTATPSTEAQFASPSTASHGLASSSTSTANVSGENWVYPSPHQFYSSLMTKHSPEYMATVPTESVDSIVAIHNAVNERAWSEIMRWEKEEAQNSGMETKLVSFKGRAGDMTPRARWRSLIGYAKPFDRHDWIVERIPKSTQSFKKGEQIRYVIDFYKGRGVGMAFFLDVRPALDGWEGVRMRWNRWFRRWGGQQKEEDTR